MSGRKSRNRGANHERWVARQLSDIVPEGRVITSRDGRGGAQGGADLLWLLEDGTTRGDVLGWSVECKTTEGLFPTQTTWGKWLDQATDDSPAGCDPAVVFRQHGRSDVWVCVDGPVSERLLSWDGWLWMVARGER